MDFVSLHSNSHKRSLVVSPMGRATRICKKLENVASDVQRIPKSLLRVVSLLRSWRLCNNVQSLPASDRRNILYVPGTRKTLSHVLCKYVVEVADSELRCTFISGKDRQAAQGSLCLPDLLCWLQERLHWGDGQQQPLRLRQNDVDKRGTDCTGGTRNSDWP